MSQAVAARERRAALSLAGIFSLRMLGLFLVLPVFSLYADSLSHSTPLLVGFAVGAYGLTQALFQIPFGMLSDRYGRKPVIAFGLLLFALGSIIAAYADSIYGVILGRALQGSGAVAAAVMALASDLTREEHRTRTMAVIGMSIGLSFAVSLVLGPVLEHWIGMSGIFWLTAALALLGIVILYFAVPAPQRSIFHRDTEAVPQYFRSVLTDGQLLRLDFGIFTLHMVLTATFVALPFALRDSVGLQTVSHWKIYLPTLLVGIAAMVPLVIVAEKQRRIKGVYLIGILGIIAAEMALVFLHGSLAGLVVALLLFFMAFNVLEALLPSLIAKFAPPDKKGTAMGVYSTSQFIGAFCGGLMGGALFRSAGLDGVFFACAVMAAVWVVWARSMATPRYLSNYLVHLGRLDGAQTQALERRLRAISGVVEVVMVADEGAAYLKIDSREVDKAALEAISAECDAQERRSGGQGSHKNDASLTGSAGETAGFRP